MSYENNYMSAVMDAIPLLNLTICLALQITPTMNKTQEYIYSNGSLIPVRTGQGSYLNNPCIGQAAVPVGCQLASVENQPSTTSEIPTYYQPPATVWNIGYVQTPAIARPHYVLLAPAAVDTQHNFKIEQTSRAQPEGAIPQITRKDASLYWVPYKRN